MHLTDLRNRLIPRRLPLLTRIFYGAVIIMLLIAGLIGLVLPVIPGLVFLALAAWMLTRVSRRFARYAASHPQLSRHLRVWNRSAGLSMGAKLKLSLLVTARALLQGLHAGALLVRKRFTPPAR